MPWFGEKLCLLLFSVPIRNTLYQSVKVPPSTIWNIFNISRQLSLATEDTLLYLPETFSIYFMSWEQSTKVLSMTSKAIRLSTGSIFPKGPGKIYFYRYQVDGLRNLISPWKRIPDGIYCGYDNFGVVFFEICDIILTMNISINCYTVKLHNDTA